MQSPKINLLLFLSLSAALPIPLAEPEPQSTGLDAENVRALETQVVAQLEIGEATRAALAADLANLIANPARRSQYISDHLKPQEFLALVDLHEQEITNGPLLGVIFSAVFTSFTGGLALGGLALLLGVIQILLSPQPQEAPQRAEDPNFAPQFGSNEGTGGVVRLGQPIGAIFCSRTLDLTGGYTTGGSLINARIETIDGSQVAYLLYSIGHGEIGNVDLSKTLLNQQPVAINSDLALGWKPGKDNDAPIADFADLSQNATVRTNQYCGINFITDNATIGSPVSVTNAANFVVGSVYTIGDPVFQNLFMVNAVDAQNGTITPSRSFAGMAAGTPFFAWLPGNAFTGATTAVPATTGNNSFSVLSGEIDSYTPSGNYLAVSSTGASTAFRVLSKTTTGAYTGQQFWRIDVDTLLPEGIVDIYSYNTVKYRTTRRVNQIDLNFRLKVWGRGSIGSLIDFAQLYVLKIRRYDQAVFTNVCRFYVRSYNPGDLYRSIEIKNLLLYTYDVQIQPETTIGTGALPIIELKDNGAFSTFASQGYDIRYQGAATALSTAQLNALISQDKARVPQHSAQGSPTLQLLHANEREYTGSTPRAQNLGYPGLACVWVRKRFTIDTSGQLQFQFFVSEGIIVDSLLAAGEAAANSTPLVLRQLNHGLVMAAGLILRNADKGVEATIIQVTPNEITTSAPLNWEQDDRWYAHGRRSSCWWPEIKAWLLKDPRFGASNSTMADYDLNYPSLVQAAKYCSGQNQFNQSFAWHGVLTRPQKVAELDAENCAKVNLFPIDIDGSKGYWPMSEPNTVGLFNSANATDFKISHLPELELDPPTSCTISHKEQQQAWLADNALRFLDLSVTAAVKNAPPTKEISFAIPECTSRAQAIVTSKIRLNYGRYFGKTQASLNAKQIEAVSLELGGLVRVQLQTMNYDAEQSGVVIETNTAGDFRLDNEFSMVRSLTTAINATGLTDASIDFIAAGVATGDLIKDEETGIVSTITGVATHSLICTPAVPIDHYYQIANLTPADVLLWRGSAAQALPPSAFTVNYTSGHLWYALSQAPAIAIEVGEVVQIGSNLIQERAYQVLSIGYQVPPLEGNEPPEMSISVTAVGWDKRMFDFTDVEVTTIDDVIG